MKAGIVGIAGHVLVLYAIAIGAQAAAADVVDAPTSGDEVISSSAPGWTWNGMLSFDDPSFRFGSGHAGGPGGAGIYAFSGSGVDVYAMVGPVVTLNGVSHRSGKMNVSIDNNLKDEISVRAADQDYAVHVYSARNLAPGYHVLEIDPVDGWVAVDYITVHNDPAAQAATAKPAAQAAADNPSTPLSGPSVADSNGTTRLTAFTVFNHCTIPRTIYIGGEPQGVLEPGASEKYSLPGTFKGVIQDNINTGAALAEFDLNANGADWYDVSYVNGYGDLIGITPANNCDAPTCTRWPKCPTYLNNSQVLCYSPCTAAKAGISPYSSDTARWCCTGAYRSPSTCNAASWPAPESTYISALHSVCTGEYAYAYDDAMGLHTCPTGGSYTVTFCP